MVMRVLEQETSLWIAGFCLVLTIVLMLESLLRSEQGLDKAAAGAIGFKKVLAAHSFTWIGVQTMFVYMFAYVQDTMPTLGDVDMGRVVSISFLILNAVGALVPVLVLEPITEKIGRVKTHMFSMAIMAAAYAAIVFVGTTPTTIYLLMAVAGIGWGATVSLPFAIMSQKIDQARMGLYMGLFNLSVVLPQLVASLGVGEAVNRAADKSLIFIICAVTLAVSALAWTLVKEEAGPVDAAPASASH
jgi:MFS family permease